MAYDAKAVANYFLKLARAKKETLDHMKLQKLIYFAHGWHLAIRDEPLLDEQVEAWSYGPVIPSIYHEFKDFGSRPITKEAMDFDAGQNCFFVFPIPSDGFFKALLDKIWETYGKFTGIQLANMTHIPGGPWDQIHKKPDTRKGTDIPDDVIKDWFISSAQSNKKLPNAQ